jgi:hypothetical protein
MVKNNMLNELVFCKGNLYTNISSLTCWGVRDLGHQVMSIIHFQKNKNKTWIIEKLFVYL